MYPGFYNGPKKPVDAPKGNKKQLRIGFILSAVFVVAIIALVLVLK